MRNVILLAAVLSLSGTAALLAQESRGQVFDFGAKWCGPCQQVAPVVEKLQREGLPIRKIDIDQQKDLANRFQIQQIPTFVLVVDGKEVDRVTGNMTESDLRRMVARIPQNSAPPATAAQPSPSPAAARQPVASGPMSIPVDLGEPAPLTRPAPLQAAPAAPETPARVAENDQKCGLRDLLSLGRKRSDEAPVVRGNDSPLQDPAVASEGAPISSDPMESSVRIRVITNGRIDLGSGTIISSSAGMTRILTCAHIFKEFTDDSRIEVDLFERGGVTPYTAGLIKADPNSDLGLISIPTTSVVPRVRVAGKGAAPRLGDSVSAIGCSGGSEPTRQQSKVTDIDKYEGPHNVLCTGVPVRGRSGGGLFNEKGEVIGVCSAADEREQRGFYSGLLAIHQLLDECQLTALYATPAEAPQTPAAALKEELASTLPASSRDFPEDFAASTAAVKAAPPVSQPVAPAASTSSGSGNSSVDVQAGDAEVVVIIRDRTNPGAANRVVILHSASPKFMSYLSGELTEGELKMDALGDVTSSLSMPEVPRPVVSQTWPALVSGDSGLQPTALSQPVVPQKYVRSALSR